MSSNNENFVITVKEFKMWLSGIESMNSDTWHPNKSQWKKIREKIDCISDEPSSSPSTYSQPNYPYFPNGIPPVMTSTPQMMSPPPSSTDMLPSVLSNSESKQVQTPNIDTSSGVYQSGFA